MNLSTYQIETQRTCPDLGNEPLNLSHMVLGIFSEYAEYLQAQSNEDYVNMAEEITDGIWYFSNYCNFRNYSLSDLWDHSEELFKELNVNQYSEKNYVYTLSVLQDLVKKNLAYSKEIDTQREQDVLLSVLVSMKFLWLNTFEFDLERSLENNINKLRIRFPEKFDKNLAVNRNLDAERKELEK